MSIKFSAANASKPKGQMKCFHCRKPCPSKEGNWAHWKKQQVFLCKSCELSTQNSPERKD